MDEIIPNLWIGDLRSALDMATLKKNNIFSILSAMRGKVMIHETFIRHQILLDDTEEADVLVHFLPSITFIQAELDKGRGVLVHCQAGMSRSATIVAAYLMYTRNLDPGDALELIRKSRPVVDPNPGFLVQLEVFHKAAFKISKKDKATRMFYMERTVEEIMNGDGTMPPTDMFASLPHTPSSTSTPTTPVLRGPRRRIRCKMCRQELAAREHMLDHGQLGAATPAFSGTPISSRRPSTSHPSNPPSRHPSMTKPRRPSGLGLGGLSMSSIGGEDGEETAKPGLSSRRTSERRGSGGEGMRRPPVRPFTNLSRSLVDSLSMSALEDSSESEAEDEKEDEDGVEKARRLGRRMSDAISGRVASESAAQAKESETQSPFPPPVTAPPSDPNDIVAQLYANPKLAALRTTEITDVPRSPAPRSPVSAPILVNPKCSGYFVEPMKWMEPFISSGQLAGKIVCPNKKCSAKLGNYDWAGVCCGCKEWVTPGFCISRAKVDEIVI